MAQLFAENKKREFAQIISPSERLAGSMMVNLSKAIGAEKEAKVLESILDAKTPLQARHIAGNFSKDEMLKELAALIASQDFKRTKPKKMAQA